GNTDWPSNNISYYRYTGPQFGQEKGDWSHHPLTTGHASDFAAISCWTLNFRAGEPIWLRERRSEATIRSSVNNGLTPSPRPSSRSNTKGTRLTKSSASRLLLRLLLGLLAALALCA